MIALIDADGLVYRAGFAGRNNGDDRKIEIVLHNVKSLLNNIMDATGAWDFRLFLTGSGNFREEVAVSHGYKANRQNAEKPFFYKEIREYLVEHWGAEIIDGMEADDALAIAQMENFVPRKGWSGNTSSVLSDCETIISSIDKDLDMVPGWHYNYVKDELYWVTEHEGILWFWRQMLMGDTIDNIIGIRGIGPKKSLTLLQDCETPDEMACVVGKQYALHFDDPEARMIENGHLLWMKRSITDSWELTAWPRRKEQESIRHHINLD